MLHITGKDAAINYNERTLTAFSNNMKKGCENYKDRLTYEVLTDNMNVLEIKFTECLLAKTFQRSRCSRHRICRNLLSRLSFSKRLQSKTNANKRKNIDAG